MDLLRGEFEFPEDSSESEKNAGFHETFTEFEGTGGCAKEGNMPGTVSTQFFEGVIPTHLLMVSFLEHICTLYEVNEDKSKHLFQVLCQQLVKMKLMPSFTLMSDFTAIRKKYQGALVDWLNVAVSGLNPQTTFSRSLYMDSSVTLQISRVSNSLETTRNGSPIATSRYRDEYEQIREVGKGGFGSVYKVRNNLDRTLYAVKKVQLAEENYEECLKVLREVKVLAKLTHANIVRYHSAWLEYSTSIQKHEIPKEASVKDLDSFSSTSIASSDTSSISFRESPSNTRSSNHRLFTMNTGDSESLMSSASMHKLSQSKVDDLSMRRSNLRPGGLLQGNICRDLVPVCAGKLSMDRPFSRVNREKLDGRSEKCHKVRNHSESSLGLKEFGIVMYIQMELCSATLKDWLTDRNICLCADEGVDWDRNINIFKQLLEGVKYIHNSGLIHRDLKPRNVFINRQNGRRDIEVKIGDFGLARDAYWIQGNGPSTDFQSLLEPLIAHSRESSHGTNATSGVGTCTYAAPEQLRDNDYSYKADIFSLGIILFELFCPFKTEMERVLAIKSLRKGEIAEQVMKEWPPEGDLIKSMMSNDPSQRPSADTILLKSLFYDKDTMIAMLQKELAKKEAQIMKLKEDLSKERLRNSGKSFNHYS